MEIKMKYKLPYTKEQLFEFIVGNPNLIAKRIIKADVDEISTYSLINTIRQSLFLSCSFDSLEEFNRELLAQGWGKREV